MPVPWPVASSQEYGGRVTRGEVRAAPIEEVPLAELVAVQRTVGAGRLAAYRRGEVPPPTNAGYPRDLPIVVRCRGKLYVHDGHHRLTASKDAGLATGRARVVAIEPHPLKRWAGREPG